MARKRRHGWGHRRARTWYLSQIQWGVTRCPYHRDPDCPGVLQRGDRLDLAHDDNTSGWLGMAHRHCNRKRWADSPNAQGPNPEPSPRTDWRKRKESNEDNETKSE